MSAKESKILARVGKAVINALPSCEAVAKLASASLDRPLSLRERMAVRVHLPLCEACKRYTGQLRLLHELAPKSVEQPPPQAARLRPEESERLKRALSR
ncbi:MAG: zf-HC2 domain-containing protein [Opitutaceae bacterium]|nr:zf-HC2 domain-containing protein [Opitutaceae bacterium]